MKPNLDPTATAQVVATAAARTGSQAADSSTDGRLMGILSIAASPGSILISPVVFSVLGFFLAMLGLTLAAPKQRYLSIIGIVAALICGAIGYYFKTQII